jgi:Cu+-exporting ATPase
MTCASCVARVERTLARVEGVERATVNLATGKASVDFAREKVGLGRIQEAIRDAGYEAGEPASTSAEPDATERADLEGTSHGSAVRRGRMKLGENPSRCR